jgi:hypothetical protein
MLDRVSRSGTRRSRGVEGAPIDSPSPSLSLSISLSLPLALSLSLSPSLSLNLWTCVLTRRLCAQLQNPVLYYTESTNTLTLVHTAQDAAQYTEQDMVRTCVH